MFPSADEHEEHECENMKNMNVQSQSVITNLGLSCYEFENMDLGTRTWNSCGNKHKNKILYASFRIKTRLS